MTIDEIKAAIAAATEKGDDTAELEKQLAEAEKAAENKVTEPVKNGKEFSQADVDKAIKARLERQKRQHETEIAALNQQIEDANASLKEHEEVLGTYVDERIADLPEATKKLLMEFDPMKRYKWLAENPEQLEPIETPLTPRNGRKQIEVVDELANKNLV